MANLVAAAAFAALTQASQPTEVCYPYGCILQERHLPAWVKSRPYAQVAIGGPGEVKAEADFLLSSNSLQETIKLFEGRGFQCIHLTCIQVLLPDAAIDIDEGENFSYVTVLRFETSGDSSKPDSKVQQFVFITNNH